MHRQILSIALALAACMLLFTGSAFAGSYNYITPEQVKANLKHKTPMHVLDIQVADAYAKHHLPGAMQSCAYPVKSAEDKAKLDGFIGEISKDAAPVVIVCPRGKGGAERTYEHLKEKGIAESRLLILEGGQDGWPYPESLAN